MRPSGLSFRLCTAACALWWTWPTTAFFASTPSAAGRRMLVADARRNSERRAEALADPDPSEEAKPAVRRLLTALEFLGPMRFITVGDSAILETVAEIEAVTYKDMDDGTTMATLKSLDASFEAHLRLETLERVTMEEKPRGDRTLCSIRFISKDNSKPALVCLLDADPSQEDYDEEAIVYWEGLCDKFGPELVLD